VTDDVPPLPRRLGGRLSLDFVNTVEARTSAQPQELLVSPSRLVDWALAAGALHAPPSAAAGPALLRQALALREAFRRIVLEQGDEHDLHLVNDAIGEAGAHAVVRADGDAYAWGWSYDAAASLLWPVARDMGDLLTDSATLARVRTCALDTCGWLFVDHSRNRSRRWCSMEGCGNLAKSRTFHARHRTRRA
jgi:predicted RNA-binding Zn ribbon-like protein